MTSRKEKVRQAAGVVQDKVSDKLRKVWWAFFLRGLLALGLAVCALFWPERTVDILTKILGIYFIIDGFAGFVGALRSGDKGTYVLAAIISLVAGLTLLFWTDVSEKMFLIIVGVWAAFQGLGMLISSWQMDRGDEDRTLVAIVGLVLALVGIVFVFYPATGVVAVSWLIALGAFVVGGVLIYLAIRLKRVRKRVVEIGNNA